MPHVPVRAERCAVASGATLSGERTHLAEEVREEGFHGWEAGGDDAYVHLDSVRVLVEVEYG